MLTPPTAFEPVPELLLLTRRIAASNKQNAVPEELSNNRLTSRHLSLLLLLLFRGPQTVTELTEELCIERTTVSLLITELCRAGAAVRYHSHSDGRTRIVAIRAEIRPAVMKWIAPSISAWEEALRPLTPAQRRMIVDTLATFASAVNNPWSGR
jgi:DNA-binding MarR family transcriptional regulator